MITVLNVARILTMVWIAYALVLLFERRKAGRDQEMSAGAGESSNPDGSI